MDEKHRWMINELIKSLNNLFINLNPNMIITIEPEKYYNHYGLKGYVDVFVQKGFKTNMAVDIYEIKTDIDDLGAVIRQLNTPIKALDECLQCSPKNIRKILCFLPTKKNLQLISDNEATLKIANIWLCVLVVFSDNKIRFNYFPPNKYFVVEEMLSGKSEGMINENKPGKARLL